MGIFGRLLKIGEAEANKVVDKLEDPITMMEQAVKDLRKDLGLGVEALASTKTEAKRARKEYEESARKMREFLESAERLQTQPDKQALAKRALDEARRIKDSVPALKKIAEDRGVEENVLQKQVDDQQRLIADYERKLVTLRQRDKAVTAKEKFNKRRAGMDPASAQALLERMEKKIDEKEASADSYGEIADQRGSTQSLEEELRHALPPPDAPSETSLQDEIAALKAQL